MDCCSFLHRHLWTFWVSCVKNKRGTKTLAQSLSNRSTGNPNPNNPKPRSQRRLRRKLGLLKVERDGKIVYNNLEGQDNYNLGQRENGFMIDCIKLQRCALKTPSPPPVSVLIWLSLNMLQPFCNMDFREEGVHFMSQRAFLLCFFLFVKHIFSTILPNIVDGGMTFTSHRTSPMHVPVLF